MDASIDRPPLPEPGSELADPKQLFVLYLDYYRSVVAAKLSGLSDDQLREPRLPSGWSALELLKHLAFMERRWLVWGFAGERVDEPWGDDREGRWHVDDDESVDDLLAALHAGGERTRAVVGAADLADLAAVGGRFGPDQPPPTLAWILFHVLQEYARHAGHLDVVRELTDGAVGE